jgi:hypothetical protein
MASKFRFIALGVVALGLAMGVAFGLGVAYGKGDEPKAETGGITLAQIQQMIGASGGGGGAGAGGAGAGGAGAGGAGAGGAGAGGSGAAGGGNTAAAASARSTAGRITAVQGQTVTIEIRPGLTQKLNLAATTVVNKLQTGAGADLKEGSSVLVSGTRKDDGSFDVATINIVPPEVASIVAAPATTGGAAPGGAPGGAPAATPAAPAAPAPGAPPSR